MDKIRLLIVSDDSSSRRGLAAIFSTESVFNLLGSYSLSELQVKAASLQPDVLLFDISDEILKYKSEIQQAKNNCPFSLILVLIENEICEELLEVLTQGVDGCVPKDITRGCLVKAVELACRARLFFLPNTLSRVVSFGDTRKTSNTFEQENTGGANLTKRETEILQLMAKNYSNREIAKALYISEPTVKTHVSSILRKLGQSSRAQAIVYSYKNGLLSQSVVGT